MKLYSKQILAVGTAMAAALAVSMAAQAADLPKSTQKVVADLKIDASTLDGLDAELAVPQAWIDAAAKEEGARVLSTWRDNQFPDMVAPFKERYPDVKLSYTRSGMQARGMAVLIAFSQGRAVADVVTNVGDQMARFAEAKAMANLGDLPALKNMPNDIVPADGTWAAFKTGFRCFAYNTNLVKKEDLPKTWEDLLTIPAWRNGNLAISNLRSSWLLTLWGAKGEEWGADFTKRLFTEVQPQQRKEGMSTATSLTVAGEFHANLPAPEWYVSQMATKGAPIDYHCPEPVLGTVSQLILLENSPNKNSAKLFINWLMSKEGQLMQYAVTDSVPTHPDLQNKRFIPFADNILGKPRLLRDESLIGSPVQAKMDELWNTYWQGGGAEGGEGGG